VVKKIAIVLNVFLLFVIVSGQSQAQQAGAPSPLSPEVLRRIQSEVRSRYSVPRQVDVSVAAPGASEVPGFDRIVLTFSGAGHSTTHDFLISTDRKTLAHLEKFDISQDFMSKIDVKGRPVRGNAAAKVTIVNFDDFQCPFCSRMHSTLFPGILKKYGSQVKFIYRDYPLTEIHPWAMRAAVNANCLAAQNSDAYWEFADNVHEKQRQVAGRSPAEAFTNLDNMAAETGDKHHLDSAKLKACVAANNEAEVRASMLDAEKMGVDSTPTMFINGEKIASALTEEEMRTVLDRALVAVGEKPPPADKPAPAPDGAKK
jgi:protein-disulfide isomerase